jgi:DNA-nicking Smr family endonuclease
VAAPSRPIRTPPPPSLPPPPPLAPLERRTRRALARGRAAPEAKLDLHGLTQAEAHGALISFLRRARSGGLGLVLVVTGRGRDPTEGGVLRRNVPHWLRLPELRDLVLGFEEAGTRQGGAGALYVRLRRSRPLA